MYQTQQKYKQKNTLFIVSSSTGKERDSETGFSYFGARYYDSDILTGWLSVDPMADKYPNLSPYNYCANNPMKLVDPDGRMVDWVESMGGTIYWDDNATSQETTKAGEKYLGKNVLVGTHGRDENLNESVNAATFDLYLESDHSGPIATIRGNTVPCDVEAYGTLPEGLYKADEQSYKGNTAILITSLSDGSINLPTVKGNPNNKNNYYLLLVILHCSHKQLMSILCLKSFSILEIRLEKL